MKNSNQHHLVLFAPQRVGIFWVLLALLCANPAFAAIRYVMPGASGSGDGTSWSNASGDLQAMINASNSGDEVWVAAGTYYPTISSDRTISFSMKNGVAVYGGFSGTETLLSERNWVDNVCILSGDIGTTGDNSDNSYHVIYNSDLDNSAVLDGFIISGGNANGSIIQTLGGGMCNINAAPTVANCTFFGNMAFEGGGVFNSYSSPSMSGCTFSGNTAAGYGGGMYNVQSSPELTNCIFSDGNSALYGGGMFNHMYSNPMIANNSFSGNSASQGAGMFNHYFSAPMVTNCTFSGNSASYEGGGMLNSESSPTVANCTFSGNSAVSQGGGMCNYQSEPILTDCNFSDGNSALYGGGMYDEYSSPTLTNCTFSGNSAAVFGGGMYNIWFSSPILTNCSFSGNSSDNEGGGIYNQQSSSPEITDCSFIGNMTVHNGGGMCNQLSSAPKLTNCSFSGNTSDYYGGGMCNIESAPELTGCIFDGNFAPYGGGMFNHMSSAPLITRCSYLNNSSLQGGGIFNHLSSSPTVTNCVFFGNSAGDGGAIANGESSPTFINCTFSGNSANQGGGIMNYTSYPVVTNCILWGNGGEIFDFNSTPVVTYSIVQDGYLGAGNLDADPLFVNATDLHLQDCSPAIDAGTAAGAPANDLDGNARPFDAAPNVPGNYDMGAYEFQSLVPVVAAACQNVTVQLDANHTVTVMAGEVNNNSSGCGLIFLLDGQPSLSFDCADVGEPRNVVLTVTDAFANTDACSATISVADDNNPCCAPPVAVCQPYTAQLDGSGEVTILAINVDGGSTAECGLQSLTVAPSQFDCSHVGTLQTVTLTIVDINGDSDDCTATVTVADEIVPVALCQNITVTPDGSGVYSISPAAVDNGSFDNCEAVLSVSPSSIPCFHTAFQQTVTLTATDPSSNSSYCTAVVTLLGDADCDGVADFCDVCPGGNDQIDNNNDGQPDCHVYPGFSSLSSEWKCSNGHNKKVYVCHNGHTICISENAVAAHLAHGDYIGPCGNSSCEENSQKSDASALLAFQENRNDVFVEENGFSVYPNPTSGRLIIVAHESFVGKNSTLEINSVAGTLMQSRQIDTLKGERLELNAANLSSGTYFLTVRTEGQPARTVRFVVQNN